MMCTKRQMKVQRRRGLFQTRRLTYKTWYFMHLDTSTDVHMNFLVTYSNKNRYS